MSLTSLRGCLACCGYVVSAAPNLLVPGEASVLQTMSRPIYLVLTRSLAKSSDMLTVTVATSRLKRRLRRLAEIPLITGLHLDLGVVPARRSTECTSKLSRRCAEVACHGRRTACRLSADFAAPRRRWATFRGVLAVSRMVRDCAIKAWTLRKLAAAATLGAMLLCLAGCYGSWWHRQRVSVVPCVCTHAVWRYDDQVLSAGQRSLLLHTFMWAALLQNGAHRHV